jgi:tetratricopeptide (TPR) repeat protein
MMEGRPKTSHLPGVFQSLAAGAIAGLLSLAVGHFWDGLFGTEVPAWAEATLSNAIGAGVVFAMLALGSRLLVDKVSRYRRATATATGDRLSIYVADLDGDDETGTLRRRVMDTILRELGRDTVELIEAGVLLQLHKPAASDDDALIDAVGYGQALLRRKHGDLLIWGHVAREGALTQIDVRFISSEIRAENTRVGMTDRLLLEPKFVEDMGAVLAAMALIAAEPATEEAGTYLADRLVPFADRLRHLVRHPKTGFRSADRAQISYAYGMMQAKIGDQTGQRRRLEEAVDGHRAALRELTRNASPGLWATCHNSLANALTKLGALEKGTARFEEAVTACLGALEEWTRERTPLEWAGAQNNLAIALWSAGDRRSDTGLLELAASTYRALLEVWTRERVPSYWAMAQNNLGAVLVNLGERECGTSQLEEAVRAFRAALQERPRQRTPLDWAQTQNNLGVALATLGDRRTGTVHLEAAAAAYRDALKEWSSERVPQLWASAQNNLGVTLMIWGSRESGTLRLEQALSALRLALDQRPRHQAPLDWAMTQHNLGNALRLLGERENSTARLETAVIAYRLALEERPRELLPLHRAETLLKLGAATRALGAREAGTARLMEAVAVWAEVLMITQHDWPPERVEEIQIGIDEAKTEIDRRLYQ